MYFEMDATELAYRIKDRELTVTEVVKQAITNIRKENDRLNAVTHIQEKAALQLAMDYDELLESTKNIEELPFFFGVPILLKDLGQEQAGQPSTSGSQIFANYTAEVSSNFTKKVEEAGFVIVGRTSTPEFGFKNETDSQLHGYSHNPNDLNRSPGGSSGGAAAALKAGWVPIVTASDGGGSIRIPASFSGLIGLKPTRGRMPVGPGSYRGWQGASIDFGLTRSIRDTWNLLKALQVEQIEAPFYCPQIKEDTLTPLNYTLKIAYSWQTPLGDALNSKARQAQEETIQQLRSMGHHLVEVELPTDGHQAMRGYYQVNGVETQVMMDGIAKMRNKLIDSEEMEPTSWALYRSGVNIPAADYSRILTEWDQMAALMESFFTEYDIYLSPTTNGPAFELEEFVKSDDMIARLLNIDALTQSEQADLIWEMFERSLSWTPFTPQANLTGQPALSLPLYETKDGLPIGMQFWAGRGKESLLLQLGLSLENEGLLKANIIRLLEQ